MRYYLKLIEQLHRVPTLYHGTCQDSADALLRHGWEPNTWPRGGNSGDPNYLYLTTDPEDAMWFANEKGCDVVIAVEDVPLDHLEVDPDDGSQDTVDTELSNQLGLPGKVVLTKPLPAHHFRRMDAMKFRMWGGPDPMGWLMLIIFTGLSIEHRSVWPILGFIGFCIIPTLLVLLLDFILKKHNHR